MDKNIIREINVSNNISDLWDDVCKKSSNDIFLFMKDGFSYRLRLIGRFMAAQRLYLNNVMHKFLTPYEKKQILRGNNDVKDGVIDRAKTTFAVKDIRGVCTTINKLHTRKNWSPVLISNAIVLDTDDVINNSSNVVLVCLNMETCLNIISNFTQDNAEISGVNAYDIVFHRKGTGIDTKYDIDFSDSPKTLHHAIVSCILRNGLFDIPSALKSINRKFINYCPNDGSYYRNIKTSKFIYQPKNKYRMSSELMNDIYEQANELNQVNHSNSIDSEVSSLPQEFFEENNKHTIGSLEL